MAYNERTFRFVSSSSTSAIRVFNLENWLIRCWSSERVELGPEDGQLCIPLTSSTSGG